MKDNLDFVAVLKALPEVIAAASASGLGSIVLLFLLIFVLALRWFPKEHVAVRITIFVLLLAGVVVYVAALLQEGIGVLAAREAGPITKAVLPEAKVEPTAPEPATSAIDESCVARKLAEAKQAQSFAQEGGVRCGSAGLSASGKSRSATVEYRAPPGFEIVGPAGVQDVSRNDGGYRSVEYVSEGGHVVAARIGIYCESENKPFGAGAWMRVRLTGQIEKVVDPSAVEAIKRTCTSEVAVP